MTKEQLQDFERRTFPKGTVIFNRGDLADYAYIVQSGTIDICLKLGGEEKPFETMARSDVFGEMALIDSRPRSATAVATSDAVCLVVTRKRFQDALDAADPLVYALLRLLTRRLRHTTEHLEQVTAKPS